MLRLKAVVVAVVLFGQLDFAGVEQRHVALPALFVYGLRPLVGEIHSVRVDTVHRQQAINDVVHPALDKGQIGVGNVAGETVVGLLRRA